MEDGSRRRRFIFERLAAGAKGSRDLAPKASAGLVPRDPGIYPINLKLTGASAVSISGSFEYQIDEKGNFWCVR
jgi:hypothetical protein